MSRFVVLSTHRAVCGQLVAADPSGSQTVDLVVADGLGDATEGHVRIHDLGRLSNARRHPAWDRSVVLRTLVRLSPADRGARFARLLRRNARAQRLLLDVDVVVAADRDTGYAAWRATTGARSSALGISGISGGLAMLRAAAAR